MKLTYKQFNSQLLGARHIDEFRWQAINMECSLFDQFCFDDQGATWLDANARRQRKLIEASDAQFCRLLRGRHDLDWGAWAVNAPGYVEPEAWVVQ